MELLSEIRRMPKVELHEHLDGSLRPTTILELARLGGIRLPTDDLSSLKTILSPGPSSLEVYLQAFHVTNLVLQTQESLRRAAFEMVEDWAADGLVYGEVRFAPELHTQGGLSREQVVEAVLKGLEDGRKVYRLATGLILCSMRHASPTLETAKLVNAYRQDGVVGFDIAGAEAPYRPGLHREAYEYCAEHLLSTTCHAGEVTGPDYIKEALLACRTVRIGHGTQLIQEWGSSRTLPGNGSLTRWILDRHIPLELCLSSNLQTRACSDIFDHPFDLFRKAGLAVTVCTDNRTVSDTNLSRELTLACETWGLTTETVRALQLTALDAAFCDVETMARIRTQFFS